MSIINAGFSNGFGTVSGDRVAFNVKKGMFSGTVLEEFPIKHITSVRVETTRSVGLGILLALVALICLAVGDGAIVLGLIFGIVAAAVLMGSPSVSINTAGGERRVSVGTPFQRADADLYASAIRKALFNE